MEFDAVIKEINDSFLQVIKNLNYQKHCELPIDFESLKVPDFSHTESERLKDFASILKILEPYKNRPCIYLFEIQKGNTNELIDAFKKLDLSNKSALRSKIDYRSNFLYVGKSQKGIQHRMKVHFGYKNTTEKGLQLLHWVKKLDIELKLHVYCFAEELEFLLPLYEKKFNNEFKPLIGHL